MMSPGRGRFTPVPVPVGFSVSPESQIQYQYLEDVFSHLSVSDSPSPYVFPRPPPPVHHSNVFPYGYGIRNPSYQSQIPTINNNNNRNFVQNNYGGFVPHYPRGPLRQNDLDHNSNNVSLIHDILDMRRREILERQRRELLAASIQNRKLERFFELPNQQQLELIDYVTDLMLDPSGNYVIQKLIEICNEQQRTLIILMLTMDYSKLFTICKTHHGSRAFEKMLEHVTTLEQRSFVMSALTSSAIEFSTDGNAPRVVVYCLKYFPSDLTKEFLEVVANMSFNIAKDKTGCCVLQQYVDYSRGEPRNRLIVSLLRSSLQLAADRYGNYVMQHLVSLKITRVTNSIIRVLEKNFVNLSCNKFASNVVEKLFKDSGELQSSYIIKELISDPNNTKLLTDPFANYVIGTALEVYQGEYLEALLNLIQNNSQMMGTNLYGKKLLDKFQKAKKRPDRLAVTSYSFK